MNYENTAAFTGHRPSKLPWRYDEADPRCIALKEVLTEQIRLLADRGVTTFLSGMALGTDLWCAQIVLDLQKKYPALKLHAILPCEGQDSKWTAPAQGQKNKWPASEQERYRSILKQADDVVFVEREYTRNCMLERNRYMVDNSSILLAVYNGVRRSGTGATVSYAKKCDREIIVIEPASQSISSVGGRYQGQPS